MSLNPTETRVVAIATRNRLAWYCRARHPDGPDLSAALAAVEQALTPKAKKP